MPHLDTVIVNLLQGRKAGEIPMVFASASVLLVVEPGRERIRYVVLPTDKFSLALQFKCFLQEGT